MATDVVMPRLSDSMEEGTVLKWLVEEGGEVKRGEPLVEIETDKANMTYEADTDGVLIEVIADEGDTLAVGEPIARIGEEGEAPSAAATSGSGEAAAPESERGRTSRGGDAETPSDEPEPEAPRPRSAPRARRGSRGARGGNGGERVKASPVARRMAGELGVELARLEGSGPGGRIVKADVESAAEDGGRRRGRGAGRGRAEPRAAAARAKKDELAAPRARPEVAGAHPPAAHRLPPHGRVARPPRRTSRSRSTWT